MSENVSFFQQDKTNNKSYLEEVSKVVLWVSVVQQELEAAVDGVEEAINDHLIHVVHICLPDV